MCQTLILSMGFFAILHAISTLLWLSCCNFVWVAATVLMEQHEPIILNDRYVSNYRKGSNQNKQAVLKTTQNILKLKKHIPCVLIPRHKKNIRSTFHTFLRCKNQAAAHNTENSWFNCEKHWKIWQQRTRHLMRGQVPSLNKLISFDSWICFLFNIYVTRQDLNKFYLHKYTYILHVYA